MASYEETLAGSTDLPRAGIVSDRAKLLAGDGRTANSGNIVKDQLVRNESVDAVSSQWDDVSEAVCAAKDACTSALEADAKADPKKTFTSCLSDLIDVLVEIRDGASNVFDDMASTNS